MSAQISKPPFSRRIRISIVADRMTVGHVLDFADKLRESGIDTRELVTDAHSHATTQFCGMSAYYDETLEDA